MMMMSSITWTPQQTVTDYHMYLCKFCVCLLPVNLIFIDWWVTSHQRPNLQKKSWENSYVLHKFVISLL